MPSLELYYMPASAPCRAVQMIAKELNLDVNLNYVNLTTGEQLKPEYIAMNPQHTVPTLKDNGFILWESRAIMCYLVNKYGKDDALYPKEAEKRAVIDRMLYFDMGTLYRSFADFIYPQILMRSPPNPDKERRLKEALTFLNVFLEKNKYVAGEHVTVADFSILATLSTFEAVDFDLSDYGRVKTWLEMMKTEVPYFTEVNQKGLEDFRQWFLVSKHE